MKKLISKMKVFHLIMLCIAGFITLSALPFKTQYSNIYINVTTTIEEASGTDQNSALGGGADQSYLFDLFKDVKASGFVDNNGKAFEKDFNQYYKVQVYNFQNDLNDVNNLILWYGILALIGVAFLYIFANNARNVYYKSNVLASAVFTLFMVVFGIVVLINSIVVMGEFSSNSELYNIVSVMQNVDHARAAYQYATSSNPSLDYLKSCYDCNVMTFIIYDIILIAVMVYSVFLFILSVTKYKATAERRKELEKVVAVND